MNGEKRMGKTRIDVYSIMYNEEFIVPYWLRHYETIADRIFIWDDLSTDNTKKILSQNSKVTFLELDKYDHDDGYWVRYVFPQYEQYSCGFADWVIIADADEFVYHPRLLEILKEEKEKETEAICCNGFEMISDELPTTSGQIYEQIKLGLPNALETKWTVHSADSSIRFAKGRHGPIHNQRHFNRNRNTGIRLLHYRHLTFDYYCSRDRQISERDLKMSDDKSLPGYSPENSKRMPDNSRTVPAEWFAKHKSEAVNVVDF